MTAVHALDQLLPNTQLLSDNNAVGMGGMRSADGRPLPLQKVTVRTSIAGPCARTTIEQQFVNPFDEALDVTWIFPLPSDGAIVELELRAGEIVVRGECQTRESALNQFEQARSAGFRAALLDTEQRGVQTLSLAGLPPKSEIAVRLTIVELLSVVDARFRWQFPTTIAPRYTPGLATGHAGFGTEHDTNAVPNASRLTPPLRLAGGTILDLEVEIAGPLSSLESSLHAVKLSLDSGHVRVAPSASATLNRDFILEFSSAESSSSASRAFTDGAYTVAIVEPPADVNSKALSRDAVFVVDISGSMEGAKLDAAKAALTGALHGLGRDDRFKLLAFDDRVERFSRDFIEYNDRNLTMADAWIANLHSRGGTEMLAAIQESLEGETPKGRLRTVLFITDGQSNDEARLLPAVANRRGNAAFFTLGIDTAVNESLLKLLAKAGGGACELCTPTDDIDAVVAKLETRFGTPLLSNLVVSGAARPDGQTVFSGRPAVMLIEGAPDALQIRATSPSGEFNTTVIPQRIQFSLGALWARERVSWLEERLTLRPFEEEAIKPEIVRIALANHIASKFTSFVCVDQSVRTHGERRHIVQPVEMPEQWGAGISPVPAPMQASYSSPSVFDVVARAVMPRSSPAFPSAGSPGRAAAGGSGTQSESNSLSESVPQFSARETSKKSSVREVVEKWLRMPGNEGSDEQLIAGGNYASTLARMQSANGSYDNDIGRSAAALIALLMLGSTRRKGDRRRTVKKLAEWLESQRADARAVMVLDALHDAESLELTIPSSQWDALTAEGPEGAILLAVMKSRP